MTTDLDPDLCYRAFLAKDARFDGRVFVCVTSTGIYCRPVCPARVPKKANCRFVGSAAAAEAAGFRSCLRCRPETAPGTRSEEPRVGQERVSTCSTRGSPEQ